MRETNPTIIPAIYGHQEPLRAKKTDAKNKIKNNVIIN